MTNDTKPRTDPLRVLHDAVREIGALVDESEILARAAQMTSAVLGDEVVVLMDDGSNSGMFTVRAHPEIARRSPPVPARVPTHCIVQRGHALQISDVEGASDDALAAYAGFSFAPLDVVGRAVGLLGARAAPVDAESKEILCALAGIASVAIAHARARDVAVLEESRRRHLARYFSPVVVDHLVVHTGENHRHAHRLDATVLFSDIRGFTSISEMRDPGEVMAILSAYFAPMIALVFEHGGMIDKLIGDGLMAIFGAPEPCRDHADAAVACATAMVAAAAKLDLNAFGIEHLKIGVGLHSGPVLLGDLGAEGFLDFTVLGATVNLASRIESLTKELGTSIALSAAVVSRLTTPIPLTNLGTVKVRGVEGPVELFGVTPVVTARPPP